MGNPMEHLGHLSPDRVDVCEMGNSCTKAHSVEELQEWIQRVKVAVKKKKQALKEGLLSYQDRLIAEYKTCASEVLIVSCGQGGSGVIWHITRSLLCKSITILMVMQKGML